MTAIAVAIAGAVLLEPKQRLAGTGSVTPDSYVATLSRGHDLCLRRLVVPADSAAFRFWANPGSPRPATVEMTISRGGTVVYRRTEVVRLMHAYSEVVFPMPRQPRSTRANTLCLRARLGALRIAGTREVGVLVKPTVVVGGQPREMGIQYEFLRPGRATGLSLIGTVLHRASLFKPGWIGPWTFYVCLVGFLALIAAAVAVLVRSSRHAPGRRTLAAVSGIAFFSVGMWTIVSPAFQAPDEVTHYAYVESLAQRGAPPCTTPNCGEGPMTPAQTLAAIYTAEGVVLSKDAKPPWTTIQEDEWRARERKLGEWKTLGGGGYTSSAGYSPIYYAAEVPAYLAGREGSVFDRLWLMRMLSALMAAVSVLFVSLFVRELAPGVPWAAPAAGLAVAFQPMFGFTSGSINNDSLLILSASAELYLLARALHRGLTVRLALAAAAALAFGIAVKPSMYGLAPACVITLVYVAYRDRSRSDHEGPGQLAKLGAAAVCFALVMLVRYTVLVHGGTAESSTAGSPRGSAGYLLSYLWQWYFPHLPFMTKLFYLDYSPAYIVFFQGFWANFGHQDTLFPSSVYTWMLAACGAGLVLAAVAVRRSGDWRQTVPKLLLGLSAVAGMIGAVHARSYLAYVEIGSLFGQGRYLFPAIAVFAATLVLAALAFGRRWGAVAATAIVVAMAFFDLFSMGLTLERFYT